MLIIFYVFNKTKKYINYIMASLKCVIMILFLLLVLIFIYHYFKTSLLYHPVSYKHSRIKYQQFYRKIREIVADEKYIVHKLIQSDHNIFIDTLYLDNPKSNKCVIYFHGNSGNMTYCFDMIKFFYNFSSIIIFDYRSYGKSSGFKINLNQKSLNKDSMIIWKYVTGELNYKDNHIVLYGESLGCFLAVYLTYQINKKDAYPDTLILHSPFTSLSHTIMHKINRKYLHLLSYPVSFLYKSFRLDKYINKISPKINIIIAHSIYDNIIPYSESLELFNLIKLRSNCQLINLTGSHYKIGMPDFYIYKLSEIFKQY